MSALYGGMPPHVARDTSVEAAATLAEERRNTSRAQVFGHIRFCGDEGATDEELQTTLAMEGNTERPRRRELELAGFIRDSGRRRLTSKHRKAVVWVAQEVEPLPWTEPLPW